ncbi:rubredoxin [Emticicia sp. SJ17W-69]|uniref:rubredoxin n=1 Tax=Emticicia sp. SJ17W-69 TaxID=3421657 RepID=UPI003EB6CBA1
MKKYRCETYSCGYVYDPAKGDPDNEIPPGTAFQDLPELWRCPTCETTAEYFSEEDE